MTTGAIAQNGRLKYANKLFETNSYYYAAEAYEDVIARKIDSAQVAQRLAISYDKIGNVSKAVEWYEVHNRSAMLTAEEQMRLGLLKRQLGEYDASEQLMASYASNFGPTDVTNEVLAARTYLDDLKTGKGIFELKLQPVNEEHSEIGVGFLGAGEVILASSKRSRMISKQLHSWSGNYFYDLYRAPINADGEIEKPKLLKGVLRTKFHDGPASLDTVNGYLYFTRNNYMSGRRGFDDNQTTLLKIYRAKQSGKKWVDEEELPINGEAFSTAHPVVTADGRRLYFASDRTEGFGGMDLYYVDIDASGNLGVPINMGSKVNTSQNDLFPSYNTKENLLFFASEGHAGLGGLDVYVAKLNKSGKAVKVENLGAPINSERDDFSFISNDDQTMGYFSSNRNGGKGSDDIYGFRQLLPIKNSPVLKGNATDLIAGHQLEEVVIYLVDGTNQVLDSAITLENGGYEFELAELDDDFKLVASKNGYVQGTRQVAYQHDKMEYVEDVALMPILNYYFAGTVTDAKTEDVLDSVRITIVDNKDKQLFEQVRTNASGMFTSGELPYAYNDKIGYSFKLEREGYVSKTVGLSELLALEEKIDVNGNLDLSLTKIEVGKTDLNDVIAINPIYFDLNKYNIRPDAAAELDKVVAIMKENPGMVIELGAHTDSRGSDASNRTLSDKRAKSSAKYIVSQGISKDRIYGKGYGESKLKVSDAQIKKAETEEEKEALHQQNRRTEFIIVKMK